MRIKINGKPHEILPVSKLSFDAFNTILVKHEVFDLKGYLSIFLNTPVEKVMESKIKTVSMPALHASIFDINVEKRIKDTPDTFTFRDKIYEVKQMQLETFGDTYMFDMFYEHYKQEKINRYQLGVYALAVWINHQLTTGDDRYDTANISAVYSELAKMPWKHVLPVSFFLSKKLMRKKRGFLLWLMSYTLELKKISMLSRYRIRQYKPLVKSLQHIH